MTAPLEDLSLADQRRDVLLDLAKLVNERRSLGEIFDAFATRLTEVATFDYCSLIAFEPDRRAVRFVGAKPLFEGHAPLGVSLAADYSGIDRLDALPDGAEYTPAHLSELAAVATMAERGMRRAWSSPLFSGGVNYGVFTVMRQAEGQFAAADIAFLREAGRMLASAVRQDEELERTRYEAARAALLAELAVMLQAGRTVDELFGAFAPVLDDAIGCDYVNLLVLGDRPGVLRMVGRRPVLAEDAPVSYTFEEANMAGLTRAGGPVQFRPDPGRGGGGGWMGKAGLLCAVTTVLRRDGEPIGMFSLGRKADVPFSDDDISFVEHVAALLAQAMANQIRLADSAAEAARGHLLNQMAILLNAGHPVESLVDRMLALIEPAVQFDWIQLSAARSPEEPMKVMFSRPELFPVGSPSMLTREQIAAARRDGGACVQFRPARVPPVPGIEAFIAAGIERGCDAFLTGDEGVLGSLVLGRHQNVPFTKEEMAFLEVVAAMLAQAITRERRLARARSDAARAELLNELAVLLNTGQPVESLADRVLALIERAVAFDWIQLSTARRPGDGLRVMFSRPELFAIGGPATTSPEQIEAILGTGRACAQYRPTRVAPGPGVDVLIEAGIERACDVLLTSDGGVLGNLVLGRYQNVAFTDDDLAFLEVVATLLAQAIAEAQKLARAREDAARGTLLNELALLLNAGEPVESLVGRLRVLIEQAVRFDYISLLASRDAAEPLVVMLSSPPLFTVGAPALLFPEQIETIRLMGSRVQYMPRALEPGPAKDILVAAGLERACSVLLGYKDGVLGSLTVARYDGAPFAEEEMAFLEVVATLLAQAVAQEHRLASTQAEAAKSRLLNDLALLLSAGGSVGSISDRMLATIERAVPYDLIQLLTRASADEPFRVMLSRNGIREVGAVAGISEEFIAARRQAGRDLWQYQTATAGDAPAMQRFRAAGISRVCDILLLDGGVVMGLLALGRRLDVPFSEAELGFLGVVTALLAQALANEQRVRGAEEEADEQRLIAEVGAAAARERTPEDLAGAVVETLTRFAPGLIPALGVLRDGDVTYLRPGGEPLTWALADHDGALLSGAQFTGAGPADARTPEGRAVLEAEGARAWVITPCLAAGEVSAFLLVAAREEGRVFSVAELATFRILAQIIGPAMGNARAAAETARERSLYNLALSSLSEAVILLDRDFRTAFTNSHGARLLNLHDPERRIRTLEGHTARLPARAAEAITRAAVEGEPASGRLPLILDGVQAWYDFEITPLDHPLYRLLCVATDVTSEVAAEAERSRHREEIEKASRLAALGELVGGVAHELNNPLTAIVGFTELLAASGRLGPSSEELEIIQTEALRARDIVRDLLFVARPGPVEQVDVDVAGVIDHVARLRRSGWNQKGIEVRIQVEGVRRPIRGNAHQLIQLVLNLVTNAEHALEGTPSPRIEISARETPAELVFAVADNGHGMDRATLDRVFEPFFTTKQGSGTGLGLSVSYSIVASHNGRIDVESQPGKGTCFRVVLPYGGEEPAVTGSPIEVTNGHALRVLVIDDEPNLRKLCQRLITRLGHECEVAETSADACDLLRANSFDLIFCDYRLRSETARTVVERIASVAPALVERIIIATGATTDPGVVELTQGLGLRLIAKPYGLDEIRDILVEAAELKSAL